MLKRVVHAVRRRLRKKPDVVFPLTPPLPLPAGVSEQQLFDFVTSVRVQDAPEPEKRAYGTHDFRRFVYTWGHGSKARTSSCRFVSANNTTIDKLNYE